MREWIRAAFLALLALFVAGCIRFYFWAGDRELTLPPEPEPTPTPAAPEQAAPLVGQRTS